VSPAAPHPGQFVQSLDRGLAVIRVLSEAEPLTVSEVARETELTRATARRFLLTLQQLGYARADGGRFSLTARVLELGYAYLSSLSLPQVAQPHLVRLVERVHESSSLSVLDGPDVVYVARVPTQRIMAVTISVGTRFPAYATSMGRVLLAALEPAELDAILVDAELLPITAGTVTSATALRTLLDRVARQGWALVDQELETGLRSIAVPIRGSGGTVVAAVNVSTHATRTSLEVMRRVLLPALQDAAAAIERDALAQRA
jgi:IclR family transcriptional regulator, pca regulon regulatory protein